MSRIRVRRGTTSEWTAANPVLASGEPGLDTSTGILKVGDGSTPWLSLATSYASTAAVADLQAQINNRSVPTAWTPFSYATGWSAYGGYEVPGYRKVGDIVYVRGLVTGGVGVTTQFTTFPVGFRPPTSVVLTGCYISSGGWTRIDIQTSGLMTISSAANGTWMALSSMPPFSVTP